MIDGIIHDRNYQPVEGPRDFLIRHRQEFLAYPKHSSQFSVSSQLFLLILGVVNRSAPCIFHGIGF